MKLAALGLALAVVCAVALQGQSAPARSFDVADVHPVTLSTAPTSARNGALRDGVYRLRQATMVDLIRLAYGVDVDKVTGGPHWLELDRFDLAAKVPPGTTRETVRPMLQALLAERFKLVVRNEAKPFPGQALVVAGTPKLKEATGNGPSTCQQSIDPPTAARPQLALLMSCKSMTLGTFAERLTSLANGGPVVDATGISGTFDIEFRFSPPMISGPTITSATNFIASVSESLEKSLGLKLEPRSHSLPTIFVVNVERTPTANSPAVATAFPSGAEPEFEVAEIKPSATGQQSRRILPTGQLTATGHTMRMLVAQAWLVQDDAQIVGPKSLDGPKFDLIAKVSSRPIDPTEVDQEEIAAMTRRLLVDRFHLKASRRDQVMEAPTLVVAGNHRLTKAADPNSRTKCTRGTGTQIAAGTVPVFQVACQNMTVAEFVERIQQLEPGTYHAPFTDETGIDGRWDFKLDFTPSILMRAFQQGMAAAAAAGAAQPAAGASEPTGAVTLAQAIERQLGLKVQLRRRPVSVVVVDSFDEKPTDN